MDGRRYQPTRNQRVWFSPYLLAVGLSFALFQSSTPLSCKSGDTTLSEFALYVAGEDRIVGFDPNERSYNASLPLGTDEAMVHSITTDPEAQVWVDVIIEGERFRYLHGGVGGGDLVVPLPPGSSILEVWVRPQGGATDFYEVGIEIGGGDVDPPQLIDFDFNPKTVDVSNGPADVRFDVALTDTASGVDRIQVFLESPSPSILGCETSNPSTGDIYDGVWSCIITIAQNAESGLRDVFLLEVVDNELNGAQFFRDDLQTLGFPTELEVRNDLCAGVDCDPPKVGSVSPADGSVDVSIGIFGITVSFDEDMDRPSMLGCVHFTDSAGVVQGGTRTHLAHRDQENRRIARC